MKFELNPGRVLALFLLLAGATAASAQTSIAASVYGAFNQSTTGNGTQQSTTNSPGGMVELRHVRNPFMGYQATYSIRRADQNYSPQICPGTGVAPACQNSLSVPGYTSNFSLDWVVSMKVLNIRPFALAGAGVQWNSPLSGVNDTVSTATMMYDYGGGFDWGLLPHIGIRAQYRGNVAKAPDLSSVYTSSRRFMHTAEPAVGVYFRF